MFANQAPTPPTLDPQNERISSIMLSDLQQIHERLGHKAARLDQIAERFFGAEPSPVREGKNRVEPGNIINAFTGRFEDIAATVEWIERSLQRIERL